MVVDIHAPEGGDLVCSTAENDPLLADPGLTCARYPEASYVVGKPEGAHYPKLHVSFNQTSPMDPDIAG